MTEIMQYVTRESAFHRLHPFTKLIFVVVVVALAVLTSDTVMLAALVGAIVAAAVAGGLARDLLRQVPLLVVLAAGLLVLTVLTIPAGDPLPPGSAGSRSSAGPSGHGRAVDLALAMSLRFAAMIFAFQILVISTQPRDLVHLMDRLRMPVDYTLMFLIALRFIPSLQLEGKRIHEAQLAGPTTRGGVLSARSEVSFHLHPAGCKLTCESHDPRTDHRSAGLPFRHQDTDA